MEGNEATEGAGGEPGENRAHEKHSGSWMRPLLMSCGHVMLEELL